MPQIGSHLLHGERIIRMPVILYTSYIPRSESTREINQQEHQLGRKLLREGLSSFFGLCLDEEELAHNLSFSENGKPFMAAHPEIHFNISHCDGLVVCAFDAQDVGIDAEFPGYFPEILISRIMTGSEKSILEEATAGGKSRAEWFFRIWTLKEAYVKMTGTGVDTDLKSFSFSFEPGDGSDAPVILCSDPAVHCFQTVLPTGHIVSLCCSAHSRPPVVLTPSRISVC